MNADSNEMSSPSSEASLKKPPTKAQRGVKKPKREGLPKRPMSAYNVFFKEERLRWLDEEEKDQGNAPIAGGKSKFLQMSDAIASKWKALKDRTKYEEIAREDNKRYRKAMEEYNESIIRSTRIGRAALDGAMQSRSDNTVTSETQQMSLQQAFDTPQDLQHTLVLPTGPLSNQHHMPLAHMGILSHDTSLQQLQNEALLRQLQEQQSSSVMLMNNLRQQHNVMSQLQLDQQLRYHQHSQMQHNQMQLQALMSRLQGPQSASQLSQQLSTNDLLLSLLRKK